MYRRSVVTMSKFFYSGKKMGNTKRDDGDSNRVIVGNSDNGGAANANWNRPENSNDNLGFRLAVVLSLYLIKIKDYERRLEALIQPPSILPISIT